MDHADCPALVSPSVLLPENRLFTLLQQATEAQRRACKLHSSRDPQSLYADHTCAPDRFPCEPAATLDDLGGEAWTVRFSHDGRRLAVCGAGAQLAIWDVATLVPAVTLRGHNMGVVTFSWSPDDSKIATCSLDQSVKLWDTRVGFFFSPIEQYLVTC